MHYPARFLYMLMPLNASQCITVNFNTATFVWDACLRGSYTLHCVLNSSSSHNSSQTAWNGHFTRQLIFQRLWSMSKYLCVLWPCSRRIVAQRKRCWSVAACHISEISVCRTCKPQPLMAEQCEFPYVLISLHMYREREQEIPSSHLNHYYCSPYKEAKCYYNNIFNTVYPNS